MLARARDTVAAMLPVERRWLAGACLIVLASLAGVAVAAGIQLQAAWTADALLAAVLAGAVVVSSGWRGLYYAERDRREQDALRVMHTAEGGFELVDLTSAGVAPGKGTAGLVVARAVRVGLVVEQDGQRVRVYLSDIPKGM